MEQVRPGGQLLGRPPGLGERRVESLAGDQPAVGELFYIRLSQLAPEIIHIPMDAGA